MHHSVGGSGRSDSGSEYDGGFGVVIIVRVIAVAVVNMTQQYVFSLQC